LQKECKERKPAILVKIKNDDEKARTEMTEVPPKEKPYNMA